MFLLSSCGGGYPVLQELKKGFTVSLSWRLEHCKCKNCGAEEKLAKKSCLYPMTFYAKHTNILRKDSNSRIALCTYSICSFIHTFLLLLPPGLHLQTDATYLCKVTPYVIIKLQYVLILSTFSNPV